MMTPPSGESEEAYRDLCCLGKGRLPVPPGPRRPHAQRISLRVPEAYAGIIEKAESPVDALGPTDWYQAMWPSDASMPEPKFPRYQVAPGEERDSGFSLTRRCHRDDAREALIPGLSFQIRTPAGLHPLYSGGSGAQIAHRSGNLLRLVDARAVVPHSVELVVEYHWLVLLRIRLGAPACELVMDLTVSAPEAGVCASDQGSRLSVDNERGFHGVALLSGTHPGEAFVVAAYDLPTPQERDAVLNQGRRHAADFDATWAKLAALQDPSPFLSGGESDRDRNLVAAFVNRALRNTRAGGLITAPSMLEFFGPEWDFGDCVWIAFLPASRYMLWIEPGVWANSIRTLLAQQTPDGMVPQAVGSKYAFAYSQIPNITPCARDYYVFTGDSGFLATVYPRFKAWYGWWMTHRNPSGDGIIAMGSAGQDLYSAICEYKDNGTDPNDPEGFENTCNPFTRTKEIAGRPERAYLPDIVACQARMAEDLAFFARELGRMDEASYFESEYRRIRNWANEHLWDEVTQFYYPVERATGKKVMKRTNTVYWLMWAGLVPEERKAPLIQALFDSAQFFAPIPVPMVALNDPSFNPRCGHWGDGYVWPLDVFTAFDGLLRYGEWDRAAQLAKRFNEGVFKAVGDTFQPAEYYHHSGVPCGCPIMGTAGLTPLTFKRYLRDYRAGAAAREWERFAPRPMNHRWSET